MESISRTFAIVCSIIVAAAYLAFVIFVVNDMRKYKSTKSENFVIIFTIIAAAFMTAGTIYSFFA